MSPRPHVICHMAPTVDGRIVPRRWPQMSQVVAEYERTARALRGDAWIIGRISMAPYAGRARLPRRLPALPGPRADHVAVRDAPGYAIAIDPLGKLRWSRADIDGEHVVTVLTGRVSDRYLAFLRRQGVSYLIGGEQRIDLGSVLVRLRRHFGIRRLLLEGGGKINGTFLAAGLIDELSLLLVPAADGAVGTPTLFDAEGSAPVAPLELISVARRPGGLIWARYRVAKPRK